MRLTAWGPFALTLPEYGCSTSALVADGDATFARATQRLERTAAEVESTDASARDRLLFLQAASLYRYRFGLTRRGAASVAAEAAAAVTDSPVLQSLAGLEGPLGARDDVLRGEADLDRSVVGSLVGARGKIGRSEAYDGPCAA